MTVNTASVSTRVKEIRTATRCCQKNYCPNCGPITRPTVRRSICLTGRVPGQPMSSAGLRHAMIASTKRAGITREVNLHILRHCFASHALEEGMNIKTLQYLLGHSSINTTMIYLHISEVPLTKAFSPLDRWAKL